VPTPRRPLLEGSRAADPPTKNLAKESVMSVANPQVPPPPGKKGMGVLGWLAIGCLVIVVLGLGTCYALGRFATNKFKQYADNPEMTAARLIVGANPDLELVSTDEAAGKLTIRNKETGEQVTVTLSELREGKLSFATKEGESRIAFGSDGVKVTDAQGQETSISLPSGASDLPEWVPAYAGSEINKVMSTANKRQRSGTFILNTDGTVQQLADFYEKELRGAGLDADKSIAAMGSEMSGATVTAKSADGRRTINVAITDLGGKARAILTYDEMLQQ
jgi:hypothetical protein